MIYILSILFFLPLIIWGYISRQNKINRLKEELRDLKHKIRKFKEQEKQTSKCLNDQKQMELLSIVATQTKNAIMIMDTEGNIEWINDGFTRMYGYTFDEFIAIRGSNIKQTSFSGIINERLHRCKTTGEPVFYDAPNEMRDGGEIWTHTTLTPIFNDLGEVTYLAAIDTDIHQRKTASDVLLKELAVLRARLDQLSGNQKKIYEVITELLTNQKKWGCEVDATNNIVKFINEMSDRIRIMGLNASIEAASISHRSAKGAGAGFRILSGEIIKMSEETKTKSIEIGKVIGRLFSSFDQVENSKDEVEETTRLYRENIKRLEEGLLKVEEVAETLNS